MAGTLPESPRSRQSAGERRTARGNGERDRRNDWRLSCRPVANQAGWGGGPIGGVLRGESELNGVGADSLSQKGASSLDHILGLVADHQCRRPVTEVGVHATKPGADGLVIFLRAKELDHVQGVLQRGSSLSARDVLAACPAANGFGIFTPAMTATSRCPKSSWSAAAVAATPWRVTRACAWRCRSVRVSGTGVSLGETTTKPPIKQTH